MLTVFRQCGGANRDAGGLVYAIVRCTAAAVFAMLANAAVVCQQQERAPSELLIVLADTAERRDDLPVVTRHASPQSHIHELTRGFSGRLVRLYPMVQRFVHPDRPPQPAYLLLSNNRGGFPRYGFHLDGQRLAETAYVDLHRNGGLANRFGAMNQIFPHEMVHIIVRELAGPLPAGRDNQVHAIGVRTDRAMAFSEGFAEHAQVMAIEAPDVAAETKRLLSDATLQARAGHELDAYRAALTARWSIAPKARMTFPLWFSPNEQVLRYHAVRANLFARDAPLPSRLADDPDRAHLFESVMPGTPDGQRKTAARMMATEGVVSALFYEVVSSERLQRQYRDAKFYARFGVTREDVDPIDNVYLKLFAAIREGGYDTVAIVDGYARLFPEDAGTLMSIVRTTLAGQELPRAASLWMRNEDFLTGTSLFDQYRGLPRAHTFDLNAASMLDLTSVAGVTVGTAASIAASAPYRSVDELGRVPRMTSAVVARFKTMEESYSRHVNSPSEGAGLSLTAVVYPYLWRALYATLATALVCGILYRSVRHVRWYRAVLNGVAVALVGLIAGWTIDQDNGRLAFAAPLVILGVPAALIALWRTRSFRTAAVVLAAWALASVVPALIVRPIG